MNPVTSLSALHARAVFDRDEIERLRWFQTIRYFESGLLATLPAELPADLHIDDSIYFGVYCGDEICGTVRIVRTEGRLPMLSHHTLDPEFEAYLARERNTVAEVSRLAVGRHTEPRQVLAMLIREFLRFGLRHQEATLLVASVEPPLVRVANRLLGMPLRVIGPPIDQYGDYLGKCVPILVDTVECLEKVRNKSSRYWEFFMEDMVLDLTTPLPARAAT